MPSYTFGAASDGTNILSDVINASWTAGGAYATSYETKTATAMGTWLDTAPTISAPTALSIPSITEPAVDFTEEVSLASITAMFDAKYADIIAELASKFGNFRTTYFPTEATTYAAAETALQACLNNPALYLPANVQAQIYADDQARILGEKVRAQDAVVAQFAARRYPLPAGVIASAQLQLEQKAQDELAESSRKLTLLSVEQFRFVVKETLGLRQSAMSASLDYIKALALGPDIASKLVSVGYDAKSKMVSAASSFLNARTQVADTISKVEQFNNTMALTVSEKNQAASLTLIEDKLKALLADAAGIAQIATGLFNNLHASVSASDSFSRSVGYSYSNDTATAPAALT